MSESSLTPKSTCSLIADDIKWLDKLPRTLQRDHTKAILQDAMRRYSIESWEEEIQRRDEEHLMRAKIAELNKKLEATVEALEIIKTYGDCFGYRIGDPNPYAKVVGALKEARGE